MYSYTYRNKDYAYESSHKPILEQYVSKISCYVAYRI